MTAPHLSLGNAATDISSGIANFAQGMKKEREQRRAEALQQALLGVQQMHAVAPLIEQQTKLGTLQRSADYYRAKYPDLASAPDEPAIFSGQQREKDELLTNRLLGTRRPLTGYDENNNLVLIEPDTTAPATTPAPGQQPTGHQPVAPVGQPAAGGHGNGWQHPHVTTLTGIGRATTPGERNFTGAGRAGASAHNDLTNIENSGPNGQEGEKVVNEVAGLISRPNFARLVPFRGHEASQIMQQFRLAGASDQAQVYMKRLFDLAGVVGPKRYGLRGLQNEVTLQQLWTDFGGGQFGLGRKGITAAQLNRYNAVLQLLEAGGPRALEQSKDLFGDVMPVMPDTTGMTSHTPPPQTGQIDPRFVPRSRRP